jgi:hypothetical protein
MNSYPTNATAAHHRTAESTRVPDALVLLKASHRQIEDQFETYSQLMHAVKKQACLDSICTSLTTHITLLTLYFHPAVTFVFENPAEFSRQSVLRYAKFKELLFELEHSLSICESTEKLEELRKHFQQHVKDAETVVFPRLRRSPLNLGELGKTLYGAKENLEGDTVKASVRRHAAASLHH